MQDNSPLTPAVFYILLSLAIKDRHGYEIMKEVKINSHGQVKMGPGTLYGSIKRMLADKLLIEAGDKKDITIGNKIRKYYTLTNVGRRALNTELQRYDKVVSFAKKQNLISTTSLAYV